jgi:ATP-binding cassette subfamily B protein
MKPDFLIRTTDLPKTLPAYVWHYLKNHPWALVGFMVTALIWALEMSLSPYFLKQIIDTVVQFAGDHSKMLATIIMPVIWYASMPILLNLGFRLYDYVNLRIYPSIKSSVYLDMFAYLQGHSHEFFQNNFAGSLTKKMSDITGNVEQLIRIPNQWFIPRTLAMFMASGTLYWVVHPVFGIILFTWALLFIGLSFIAAKGSEAYSRRTSEAWSVMDGTASDSISNIMNTKLFSNAQHEINHLTKDVQVLVDNDRKLLWYNLKVAAVQGAALVILTIAMLWGLIYGRTQGWVSVGDFALVLMLTVSFVNNVFDMGIRMQDFFRIVGTCNQALTFIRMPHEITNVPGAKPLQVTKGEIEFDDVCFDYDKQDPLFENMTLKINPGEKVGLVGSSGGGKSTFIKLMLRLMNVKSGRILIDDQDINLITKESLREQVGTIPQDPNLFHRSIMDNIRFARPAASDTEVIEAAKKAKCHDFIMSLPEHYQSMVGERGVKLSGGERQRIAIARAFLKNAPILLLDEATSSLDSLTERHIHESLHEVMAHKTTIVIAHRLSTLKDMDRILVFSHGKIVEDGSLEELLKNTSGHFYKLWQMQAEGFLPI